MFKVSRDPALILAFLAALVQILSVLIFNWSIDQQAVINAVAAGVAGVITAILVRSDNLAPLILGLAQAVISLVIGFGWDLSVGTQSSIMATIATLVAMFVRTQVTAPVDPAGNPVPAIAPAPMGEAA